MLAPKKLLSALGLEQNLAKGGSYSTPSTSRAISQCGSEDGGQGHSIRTNWPNTSRMAGSLG